MTTEIEAAGRTKAPRRRFTLLDGMVLVAATACGCASIEPFARQSWFEDLPGLFREALAGGDFLSLALLLFLVAVPVLAAWSLALIPLGLLPPRPKARRLARRPGMVAAVAVSTAMVFLAVVGAACAWSSPANAADAFGEWGIVLPTSCALAVLASWTTLIVEGRWRAEASWRDRLGRILGVLWMVLALASPFLLL